MVTADEIRARVEAADKIRIQARADAAARIAADIERRTKVRSELAEVDAAVAAGLAESAAIMTLTELSEFTGISVSELSPPVIAPDNRRTRRPARRKAAGGARKSRLAVADAAAPVTVSSDY